MPVVVFQHIRLYFRQAQLRETILGFQVGEPTTSDHHDRFNHCVDQSSSLLSDVMQAVSSSPLLTLSAHQAS